MLTSEFCSELTTEYILYMKYGAQTLLPQGENMK